jgi:hypothetical protein
MVKQGSLFLLLVVALFGAAAATALADKGSTGKANTPLKAPPTGGVNTKAIAKCAAGSKATGGGFKVANGFSPNGATGVRSITQISGPHGHNGWTAGSEAFGAVSSDLTSFVRCAKKPGSITTSTDTVTIDPSVASIAQARCPPTRTLLGGGFRVSPTFHFAPPPTGGSLIVPFASYRFGPRDWRVVGANIGLGNSVPGKLTAYAICGRTPVQVTTAHKSAPISAFTSPTTGKRANPVATCGDGQHTLSGGFRATPLFDQFPPHDQDYISPLVDSSAPQGSRSWSVAGAYYTPFFGNQQSGRLIAYAYCTPNHPH